MDDSKGNTMKWIMSLLAILLINVTYAGSPQLSSVRTYTTESLAAGSKDTITIVGITLESDSIGVMLDFNRDSVSGVIRYQYVTPEGNSNTLLSASDTLTSFTLVDGQFAVFTDKLPRLAGTYSMNMYIELTNNDISSSPRTITMKFYTIKWR